MKGNCSELLKVTVNYQFKSYGDAESKWGNYKPTKGEERNYYLYIAETT